MTSLDLLCDVLTSRLFLTCSAIPGMLVSIVRRVFLYDTLGGMAWCVTSPHLVGRMTYHLLAKLQSRNAGLLNISFEYGP